MRIQTRGYSSTVFIKLQFLTKIVSMKKIGCCCDWSASQVEQPLARRCERFLKNRREKRVIFTLWSTHVRVHSLILTTAQ